MALRHIIRRLSKSERSGLIPALIFLGVGIIRFPATNPRDELMLLFELGAAMLLSYFLIKHANRWVGFFVISASISSIYPFFTIHSYMAWQAIVAGAIWYVALVCLVDRQGAEFLMDAMCLLGLINVVFLAMQESGFDPFYHYSVPASSIPVVGLLTNRNEASALLALTVPAFLRPRRYLGLIVIGYGLVLARSFIGVLGVSCGAFFIMSQLNFQVLPTPVFLKNRYFGIMLKALVAGILMAFGLIYYYFVDAPTVSERLIAFKACLKLYSQHWIMGSGLGHWAAVSKQFGICTTDGGWFNYVHNEFFQALFEMGLPFLIILSGLIYNMVKRYGKDALLPMAGCIITAALCLGHFLMHIGITAMMAVTWLAIYEISLATNRPNRLLVDFPAESTRSGRKRFQNVKM